MFVLIDKLEGSSRIQPPFARIYYFRYYSHSMIGFLFVVIFRKRPGDNEYSKKNYLVAIAIVVDLD